MVRWPGLVMLLAACGARERPVPPAPPVPAPPPARAEYLLVLDEASHPLPAGAPAGLVHVAPGVAAGPATAVIYLHGWEGCAGGVIASDDGPCFAGGPDGRGWGLGALQADAGVDVLVVPQLAFLARSSSAGRFDDPAFARGWWADVRARLAGEADVHVGAVTVVAHSGGYRTLQALLAADLDGVGSAVLLDGLYGGADRVAAWAVGAPGRRVATVHTANRDTTGQSRVLAAEVRAALGPDAVAVDPDDIAGALRTHTVVALATDVPHDAVPGAWLVPVLRGLAGR